jgi:hypothetical protein
MNIGEDDELEACLQISKGSGGVGECGPVGDRGAEIGVEVRRRRGAEIRAAMATCTRARMSE